MEEDDMVKSIAIALYRDKLIKRIEGLQARVRDKRSLIYAAYKAPNGLTNS